MTSQKIIFLHCVDMSPEQIELLSEDLENHLDSKKYLFILSEKEIKSIDKEELLRVLKNDS